MWWAWGLKWDIPSNYGNFNDNLLEYVGIEMLQLWPIAWMSSTASQQQSQEQRSFKPSVRAANPSIHEQHQLKVLSMETTILIYKSNIRHFHSENICMPECFRKPVADFLLSWRLLFLTVLQAEKE